MESFSLQEIGFLILDEIKGLRKDVKEEVSSLRLQLLEQMKLRDNQPSQVFNCPENQENLNSETEMTGVNTHLSENEFSFEINKERSSVQRSNQNQLKENKSFSNQNIPDSEENIIQQNKDISTTSGIVKVFDEVTSEQNSYDRTSGEDAALKSSDDAASSLPQPRKLRHKLQYSTYTTMAKRECSSESENDNTFQSKSKLKSALPHRSFPKPGTSSKLKKQTGVTRLSMCARPKEARQRILRPKLPRADLKCEICDLSFANQTLLTQHMKGHTDVKINCHLCNKTFIGKNKLKTHLLTHTYNSGDA